MHRLGHLLPAGHLFIVPYARGVGVADAHGGDRGRFGQDQAGTGTLSVVLSHQWGWDTARSTGAGQGRHDNAVGQGQVADFDGIEQGGHLCFLKGVTDQNDDKSTRVFSLIR